jgi:hypothetical protein
MRRNKVLLLVLCTCLAGVVCTFLFLPAKSNAQTGDVLTVKLYSGEKLVATWDNARNGRVDGNTYIFSMAPQDKEVRISGTYSVEVVR